MSQENPGSGRNLTSDSVDDNDRPQMQEELTLGSGVGPVSPSFIVHLQSFKRWCPFHNSVSHTLDQCKQKWEFLRDEQYVKWRLFESWSAGPAFATNLLDWRCLMDPDKHITPPWTPEFARLQKEDPPVPHDLWHSHAKLDPSTSADDRLQKLAWQTENGEKPRFSNVRELQEYAERQYQNDMKRNELLEAFKKHDAAEEEAKKAKDDLVKAHADDPELLKMFD
ncbi:hypothetical protein GGR55DRAFT_695150 [Xylaria sp. FL0064]|nr:hypothetical protein GGR55DRAFT_695150 [Xylaria sp. FL0064]